MESSAEVDLNPHGLCTWADAALCEDCELSGRLLCRHSWADLAAFGAPFLPFALTAVAGMVRAGFGWWIAGWVAYMMLFFNVWETYILCRHCPFYARSGTKLHCLANHGCLRLWAYEPGPMTRWDKAQFLIGAGILIVFPFPFLIIGGQWLLAGIAALAALSFGVVLRVKICRACVNFSCPLNAVPKETVDAYLRRNPVIQHAWEEAGCRLDL